MKLTAYITLLFLATIAVCSAYAITCNGGYYPITSKGSGNFFEKCCPSKTDCAGPDSCFREKSVDGSNLFICSNNNWNSCAEENKNQIAYGYTCLVNYQEPTQGNKIYNGWYRLSDTSRCQPSASGCGNKCPSDYCEYSYSTEGSKGGQYARLMNYPDYDSSCINGFCIYEGCKERISSSQDQRCFSAIADDDKDGVPNQLDECPHSDFYLLLNYDVNERGCTKGIFSSIPSPKCNNLEGKGNNLRIVITPCGWDASEGLDFIYWAKKIADKIKNVEPFKTYGSKYTINYVWDTRKAGYKGYSMDSTGKKTADPDKTCGGSSAAISQTMAYDTCGKDNTIILEIAHNSGEAGSNDPRNNPAESIIGQGMAWCCETDPNCCSILSNDPVNGYEQGSWDGRVVYTSLHEMGHLFELGHPFGWTTVPPQAQKAQSPEKDIYNDEYSPSIYPISDLNYQNSPCPIWDYPEYTKWAQTNNQMFGCYQGYSNFLYTYSPLSNDAEKDDMMSSYDENEINLKYNPVGAKLIEDALVNGYDNYIKLKYPSKCEDIDDKTKRETCLIKACKGINPNLIDPVSGKAVEYLCCEGNPKEKGISPLLPDGSVNNKFLECYVGYSP
jgi:hypothetical protein